MARLHAIALGPSSAHVIPSVALLLACAALAAGCTTTPWTAGDGEERFSERRLIYLETSEFRWVGAPQREQLACVNGTLVVCTTGLSRLSLSNCGCLPRD
jgi:hypothetical protein